MTSQDNQQYITVELFNSKMETLITQIQLGNEKLRNELRNEFNSAVEKYNMNLVMHKFICVRIVHMKPLDKYSTL